MQTRFSIVEDYKRKPKEVLVISLLSVQELYDGRSTQDDQKEQYLLATISRLKILPYTYEIAQLAGEIARDLDRPIELADAVISATTILKGASLLILNKKDFINVQNLVLL